MNTQTLPQTQSISASDLIDAFASSAGTPVVSTGRLYDIEIKLDTADQILAAGLKTSVSPIYLHLNDLTSEQFGIIQSTIEEFWTWDDKKLSPESIKLILELVADLDIQQPIVWPFSTQRHTDDQPFATREKAELKAHGMFIPKDFRVPVINGDLSDVFAVASDKGLFAYCDGGFNTHYKVLTPEQAVKQFRRADGADLVFLPDGRTNVKTFTR